MAQMAASVRRPYVNLGSLKALIPLLTASTPVMAVQPLANACSRSHALAAVVAGGSAGGGTIGSGTPPEVIARQTPIARIARKLSTNVYVGSAKRRPASRVPRKFARVT